MAYHARYVDNHRPRLPGQRVTPRKFEERDTLIIEAMNRGEPQRKIAKDFEVSISVVKRVVYKYGKKRLHPG